MDKLVLCKTKRKNKPISISRQAFDRLMRIEEKFNPWLWQYKGFPIWLGLRNTIFEIIYQKLNNNKPIDNPYKNRYKKSANILKNKISYLPKSPFFNLKQLKNKHVIFAYESGIRGKYEKKNINIYIDPVRFYSPNNIKGIELVTSYPNIENKLYPTFKAIDFYFLKGVSYLLGTLLNKTNFSSFLLSNIDKKFKIRESIYNMGFSVDLIFDLLAIEIIYLNILIPYWRKFLKVLNPRSISGINWYSLENMVMYFVANNLGIPTIELQHGIITSNHFSYIFKTNNLQFAKMASPKHIIVYGEFFKKLLLRNSTMWTEDQIHPLGYPWMSFFLKKIDINTNKIKNNLGLKYDQKIILITSQNDELSQTKLIEHLKKINLQNDWIIIVKLHPYERLFYKQIYKEVINKKGILFITEKDMSLYELLKICDVHVSFWSAVLWEAPVFGIKNFILETENSYIVDDIKELGLARIIKSLDEIFKNNFNYDYKNISYIFNNLDGSSPQKIAQFICNI